jgi:hypothetical protein
MILTKRWVENQARYELEDISAADLKFIQLALIESGQPALDVGQLWQPKAKETKGGNST